MNRKSGMPDLAKLRKSAEQKLGKQLGESIKLSAPEASRIIQELQTHQIELEMQNDELRSAQEALEASRSKYVELYDFAPVGYFTVDARGLIREVNLTGAQQLGIAGRSLIETSFISFMEDSGDRRTYSAHRKEAFRTQARQICEVRLKKRGGPAFSAQLQSIAAENIDEKAGWIRTAVVDIEERKILETERERLIGELQAALSKLKVLKGLLPICAWCKSIRDDEGYWQQVDAYITTHTDTLFTHCLCPACAEKVSKDLPKNE
ncbi:MAG: hypothetical protein A2X56_12900 [Nitrospirae bacterium GWC2_57_13]|jgi:formate hydrogenlyase transcriptional activator|nr:MAG: hypothetical protein A2X56_12900 [Nitrospirae bacterium GWC2_57_13]HAS52900.1 hypothetical protein [Nitrospiraceae bacterium]